MNLLRRWDSGPYMRAFSLNSTIIRLECAHICPRSPTASRRFPKSDRLSWNIIQVADLFGPGATAKCALSDFNAEPLCSLRDSAVNLMLGRS